MSNIQDWSSIADNNNEPPPDGAPEGMLPSAVNNVIRENMAAVRAWYEDAEWISYGHSVTRVASTIFTIPMDVTDLYTTHRAIRIQDTTMLYGFITSATYSNPNTTITVALFSGDLTSSMDGKTVSLGFIKPDQNALPKNHQYALYRYAADVGTDNAYALAVNPSPISYETGMCFHFKANTANTGPATLNINSIGGVGIKKNDNSDLDHHDIQAHQMVSVIYDGTNFQMISPVSHTGGLGAVVSDTTPQLGGDLEVNDHAIVSTNHQDIRITPDGTGKVMLSGLNYPANDGINGQVLTTDGAGNLSFATTSAGGSLEPISTATANHATEIAFTDLSASYCAFSLILLGVAPSTDQVTLCMQTSTDNGITYDTGSSDYAWQMQYAFEGGGGTVTNNDGSDSKIQIAGKGGEELGNNAQETLDGRVEIFDPNANRYTKIYATYTFVDEATQIVSGNTGGYRKSAAPINAIRFFMDSGMMATGTFILYGLKML